MAEPSLQAMLRPPVEPDPHPALALEEAEAQEAPSGRASDRLFSRFTFSLSRPSTKVVTPSRTRAAARSLAT